MDIFFEIILPLLLYIGIVAILFVKSKNNPTLRLIFGIIFVVISIIFITISSGSHDNPDMVYLQVFGAAKFITGAGFAISYGLSQKKK